MGQKDLGKPIYIINYRPIIINIKDNIVFTQINQKYYYNIKRIKQYFKVKNKVKLRLYKGYNLPIIKYKKIN